MTLKTPQLLAAAVALLVALTGCTSDEPAEAVSLEEAVESGDVIVAGPETTEALSAPTTAAPAPETTEAVEASGTVEVVLDPSITAISEVGECTNAFGEFWTLEFTTTNDTDTLAMITYRGKLIDADGNIIGDFGGTDIDIEPGQSVIGASATGIAADGTSPAVCVIEEVVYR